MKFLPGAVVEVSCGGKIMLSLSYCDADAVVAVGKGSDIIVFLCGGDEERDLFFPHFLICGYPSPIPAEAFHLKNAQSWSRWSYPR
jgi:hypothetical protein